MSSPPKKLIAIATYNERLNLPELFEQLTHSIPDADLLIVDDNSPDGSPEWLQKQKQALPNLHLIIRENERGLGSASRRALQWAVEQQYDYVATMDADLSHSPDDLPSLFDRLQASPQVDVVIGSRYVKGGKIVGWSLFRKVASRLINLQSRLFLGLRTKDNSGAFRVYRVEALSKMDPETIDSNGYVYLQEVLYRLRRQNATFAEVPITFRDREKGQSKINLGEAFKAVWKIASLRWTRSAEI